jgi:hypothetical protein
LGVINKLARHFGLTKEFARKNSEADYALKSDAFVFLPKLQEDFGFDKLLYSIHVDNLPLDMLINPDKYKKSKLYAQFLEAESAATEDGAAVLVVVVHFKGNQWVLYRDSLRYSGPSGITILFEDDKDGPSRMTMMPIERYLAEFYPIENIE